MSALEPHLGGCWIEKDPYTFMPEVWEILIARHGIKSVLDLGCGAGWSVEWFAERGLSVTGVEGWEEAIQKNRAPQFVKRHDYWDGPFNPEPHDLCWAAEFLEHIDECFLKNVMSDIERCRYACITHALPGQDGWHHVNCQEDAYWVAVFARHGFRHNPEATVEFRKIYEWLPKPWGRNTIMFFERL